MAWSYLFVFFVLFVSFLALYNRMNKLSAMSDIMNDVFKREKQTILLIMAVFCFSYLIRALYDLWIGLHIKKEYVRLTLLNVLFVIWDIIPLTLILCLHYQNFKDNGAS